MAKRLNKNLVGGLTALAFVVLTAAGVLMAMKLREVDPERFVQKAEEYAKNGEYDTAAIYFGRAFNVSEEAKHLVSVGDMYELNGDETKAVQAWMQAATMDPDLLEAHEKVLGIFMLSRSAIQMKDTAEEILRIEEKNPKGLHGMGIALLLLEGQPEGDRERGFEYLEEAHEIAPEVYEYAESLVQYRLSDALSHAQSDPEQSQQRLAAALDLVQDLVAKRDAPGEDSANARALYANLISLPFPAAVQSLFGGVIEEHLDSKSRHTEAERLFQEAVELSGENDEVRSEVLTSLGRYWRRRSAQEEDAAAADECLVKSRNLLRQAIDTWPSGFAAYETLARLNTDAREYKKAAEVCNERTNLPIERKGLWASTQKRSRIRLLLFAAEQYIAASYAPSVVQGSEEQLALVDQAEALVVDARAEVPDADRHGSSLHILGKIRLAQNDQYEALSFFEKADKAIGTPRWQNKRWLGLLRYEQGQRGGAREALLQAVQSRQADARTWLTLARVHLDFNEPENAILATNEALKRRPEFEDALKVRIDANRRLGRDDLVAADMARLEPDESTPTLFRAQLLAQQGKHAESFEVVKSLLASNPTDSNAVRLASFLGKKLGKKEESWKLTQDAAAAAPEDFTLQGLLIQHDPDLDLEQRKAKLLTLIEGTTDEYLRAYRLGEYYRSFEQAEDALRQYVKATEFLLNKSTERSKIAGAKELLAVLEKRLVQAIRLEQWEQVDLTADIATENNVDGAHGMTFKGRAALVRRQLDAATEAFKMAVEEQPSQSTTWAWLGECHYQAERMLEAQAASTRATELNPDSFTAQRRLAQIARDSGDTDAFNMRLDECVRLNPEDPWVRQQELTRQEENNPEEGILRRQAIHEKDPDDLANINQLANLYKITGDNEKAAKLYEVAIKHPETVLGVAWRAASFYLDIGNRERAFEVLGEAGERAESREDKALALLMTGTLHRKLSELVEAEQHYRKAVDVSPSEVTFVSFGEFYLGLQRYEDAIEWLDKAIAAADQADSPRAATMRRGRLEALLRMDRIDAAVTALEEYRDLYPKDPSAYLLEAELDHARGRVASALSALTSYLEKNPADSTALYRRAQHYASRQRWEEAKHDLEELRARDPDALNYDPRLLLVRSYERTDRNDLALSELKNLYEKNPTHDAVCRRYFRHFMKHEQFSDAARLATALVHRDPENPLWHRFLARTASRLQDGVGAITSFRTAAELSDYAPAYTDPLLETYETSKNYDAGIRFYEDILPPEKRHPKVVHRYATLLARAQRIDDAANAFREAMTPLEAARDEVLVSEVVYYAAKCLGRDKVLELFRNGPTEERLKRANAHIVAALLTNFGKHAESLTMLDELLSSSTDELERASLFGRKAVIAEQMEDYALARQCYESALEINSRNFVILNNFAYLLADKLHKPEEAVPYAERAVQINPKPIVMDTLAWALVELGEYGRAIGLLTGAVRLDFEFIPGVVHLAETYRRSGNFEDAVAQYEQALRLMDEASSKEQREEYLEQAEIGLRKARVGDASP
ncbi:MAG: tetratricopeptide repeat protein [bacterium]|nr:tetratricopeptide repeat protein [bacterium]